MLRGARAALAFLTRLPAGPLTAEDFARAPGWFAAVGVLIGVLQAAAYLLAAMVLPPLLAAVIAVTIGVLVTGALHEDGLADVFDGLGSGHAKERALEIMRDSRIGSFGAMALVLAMVARVASLAELGALAPVILIAGQGASRAVMALMLRAGPYMRPSGAGTGMTGPLGIVGTLATSGVLLFAGAVTLSFAGWGLAGGLAGLGLGALLIRQWAMRRLGGITGDVLGSAQVMGEIGFFIGVLACL